MMKTVYFILLLFYENCHGRPQIDKLIKVESYCIDERDQYLIQCPGISLQEMPDLNPSNIKFCGNYERLCDGDTGRKILTNSYDSIAVKSNSDGPQAPMVVPPRISEAEVARYQPSTTTTMAPTTRIANIPIVISEHGALGVLNNPAQKVLLTQDIIKTCTPDCTAPQCSKECKCANTHIAVESKCNPPPSSDMVGVCQAWYAECPMFKQLQYGEHS